MYWGNTQQFEIKDSEIEFCQEYKYLGVIFDTSRTDDKEIRSRVIQARKCIACLNGILWSEDIRKERKLNIYNALIKSSLLYGSETWRLTENNKRRFEATEMDVLRRSSRISRKERIRNVTIRKQIGLEEPIIKEIEQNQLTWYGHVQRRKITENSIEVDAETKESMRKTEEKLDGRYKEGHERRKPK